MPHRGPGRKKPPKVVQAVGIAIGHGWAHGVSATRYLKPPGRKPTVQQLLFAWLQSQPREYLNDTSDRKLARVYRGGDPEQGSVETLRALIGKWRDGGRWSALARPFESLKRRR